MSAIESCLGKDSRVRLTFSVQEENDVFAECFVFAAVDREDFDDPVRQMNGRLAMSRVVSC